MFKFIQARKDYMKCKTVLASCETPHQVNSAANMINNWGRMYGYGHRWLELRRKYVSYFREVYDRIEYRERLKRVTENEQETSEHTEG